MTLEQILRKTLWKISNRCAVRSHLYSGPLQPPYSPCPCLPPRPGRPLPGRSRWRLGDAPERPAQSLLQLGSGLLLPPNNDPSGVEPVAEGCGTIKAGNETPGRCVFIAL